MSGKDARAHREEDPDSGRSSLNPDLSGSVRSAHGTDAAADPTAPGGRSPIGTPDDAVDLVAVRADDELLDAITHGRSVASSDPVESLLIQLLTLWSTSITDKPAR